MGINPRLGTLVQETPSVRALRKKSSRLPRYRMRLSLGSIARAGGLHSKPVSGEPGSAAVAALEQTVGGGVDGAGRVWIEEQDRRPLGPRSREAVQVNPLSWDRKSGFVGLEETPGSSNGCFRPRRRRRCRAGRESSVRARSRRHPLSSLLKLFRVSGAGPDHVGPHPGPPRDGKPSCLGRALLRRRSRGRHCRRCAEDGAGIDSGVDHRRPWPRRGAASARPCRRPGPACVQRGGAAAAEGRALKARATAKIK